MGSVKSVCTAALVAGLSATAAACAPSPPNSNTGDGDAGPDATAREGADGSVLLGTGDSSGCTRHCSSDLHAVLGCNNEVLTTCPPDQGCSGSDCVPACQAADANKSSIGCDYYSVDPDSHVISHGSCFAAYIANTWGSPVTINLGYNGPEVNAAPYAFIPSGQGNSITYTPLPGDQLPANEIAIVFLADATLSGALNVTHCPSATKAFYTAAEASSVSTGILHAFHITTSAPVVAYDIFPYGGANSYITSATLLIPTSAWDTNYLAIDTFARPVGGWPSQQPFTQIAAAQDGTTITISPTAPIVGGNGVTPAAKGNPVTYDLNQGEVLHLKQDEELSGSPIQSNKPIGVWGGNGCQQIDVTDGACDSGHQQLPPIKALGHEYVATRYRDRVATKVEQPPWHIMGAVDGTQLTYEPSLPPGAPATIDSGQVAMFYTAGPFVVRSQDDKHPFYVMAHMGGQLFHNEDVYQRMGDPESVNVIPPDQFLAGYVFMTDPTMVNTNLVLVRGKTRDGTFKDVALDCAGVLGNWQPVGSNGEYQWTNEDLVVDGSPVGNCDNGRHEIHSDAPFGLTVWGWDIGVSYAYPGGASVQPINAVVVPPTTK